MRQLKVTQAITNRNEASVEKYLRDIGHIKLIDTAEEVSLARRIKAGDTAALETLVRANLRFVVSVAKQYTHQGLMLSDLINEGNLGLIRAAGLFDETKGFKFISYAVNWIRSYILTALAQHSRLVRLPTNKAAHYSKAQQEISLFEQEHGRTPTLIELAEIMKLEEQALSYSFESNIHHDSLDTPITGESDATLGDTFIGGTNGYDEGIREDLSRAVAAALETLPKREAKILSGLFGIGGEAINISTLADEGGFTKERIRQIREKALQHLREKPHVMKMLVGYAYN